MLKLSKNCLFSNQKSNSKGFTLLELLLTASLTSVVIGSTFFGFISLLRNSQNSRINHQMSNVVNRGAEFISDEIRAAKRIFTDATIAAAETTNFTLPTGAKPVLAMELPSGQRVIYYTKRAENPWLGPNVIYRWGPDFNEQGHYDETTFNNSASWQSIALIDLIDNTTITNQCSTGWQSTNANSIKGFYACVKTDDTSINRLAQFHIATIADHTVDRNLSYEMTTQAFARSGAAKSVVTLPPTPDDDNDPPGETPPPAITFEYLGGAITCGAGGPNVPISNHVVITHNDGRQERHRLVLNTPLNLPAMPESSTIDIEAKTSKPLTGKHCQDTTTIKLSDPTINVRQLKNGDNVPDITPFDNQTMIEEFVRRFINNKKIVLPENQILILFELGSNDLKNAAFDLQDSVILATIHNNQVQLPKTKTCGKKKCV